MILNRLFSCLDCLYLYLFVSEERLPHQPSMPLILNYVSTKEISLRLETGSSSRDHGLPHGLTVLIYLGCKPSIRCGVRENHFTVCKQLFCLIASVFCFPGTFQLSEVPFIICLSQCLHYQCLVYEAVFSVNVFKAISQFIFRSGLVHMVLCMAFESLGLQCCSG